MPGVQAICLRHEGEGEGCLWGYQAKAKVSFKFHVEKKLVSCIASRAFPLRSFIHVLVITLKHFNFKA